MDHGEFAEVMRGRTKQLAIRVIRMYGRLAKSDEIRIIGKQLMRSSTSVAANYRAACRARSKAEFFAKLSITIEEADETLFWIELLEETALIPVARLSGLKQETTAILSILAKARKKMRINE